MPISIEPLNVLDILRSIPDSVLTIDAEKRVIALNGPAQTLTGTPEASAVGRPCGQILRSEICDTERCPFERSLIRGETVTTFNIMAKDAAGIDTPICIAGWRDRAGRPSGLASGCVQGPVAPREEITPAPWSAEREGNIAPSP